MDVRRIPKKLMWSAAQLAHTLKHDAKQYGFSAGNDSGGDKGNDVKLNYTKLKKTHMLLDLFLRVSSVCMELRQLLMHILSRSIVTTTEQLLKQHNITHRLIVLLLQVVDQFPHPVKASLSIA